MPSNSIPPVFTLQEAYARLAPRLGKRRQLQTDPETSDAVASILKAVQEEGDAALFRYARRFDEAELKAETLRVPREEISGAGAQLSAPVKEALETAARRIEDFHSRQEESSWYYTTDGALLGQAITPLDSAGLYIPGGKAIYPSTLLMNAIPARIAGVPRRVLCTPSRGGLELSPALLYAAALAGIDEIYRIGGAHAIAALALGTETIAPVDIITGPGNRFVAEAKRQVFGLVAIDMIAGPSEIMIITDMTPDPRQTVYDLFAQAEHDEDASSLLITTNRDYALRIQEEVGLMLDETPRASVIRQSLTNNGMIVIVPDLTSAFDLANAYAPEHLQIISSASFETITASIRNAGAIFFGPWTPEALGDYTAGPNHTLPTAGTARFSSPLGVYDFQKKSSLLSFSEEAMRKIGSATAALADLEGLHSHAASIRQRIQKENINE